MNPTPAFADVASEFALTRKMLERLPEGKLDWRPHEKSWSLGELAMHMTNLPTWTVMTIQISDLDLSKAPPPSGAPGTVAEVLEAWDRNAAPVAEAFAGAGDEEMHAEWTLRDGDRVFFTMPRHAVVRSMCLNHLVHHRGQLGVYLRLLDVPVPAIYGSSADEGFAD